MYLSVILIIMVMWHCYLHGFVVLCLILLLIVRASLLYIVNDKWIGFDILYNLYLVESHLHLLQGLSELGSWWSALFIVYVLSMMVLSIEVLIQINLFQWAYTITKVI